MPRLTAKDYLRTHDRLRKLWLRDPSLFAELTPMEQWQLHDFFGPDRDPGDLELLAHREAITVQHPSLPHEAGRALTRFWETSARVAMKRVARTKAPAGPTKRVRQQDRKFTIKPLARSELDAQKLSRAFIWLAHDLAKKRSEQQDR